MTSEHPVVTHIQLKKVYCCQTCLNPVTLAEETNQFPPELQFDIADRLAQISE